MSIGGSSCKARRDSRVIAALIFMVWATFIIGCVASVQGCGPRVVSAEDRIGVDINQGPPCKIAVTADGELVASVSGPNQCKIEQE